MTRRLPSRTERHPTPSDPRQLPTITYRHIPAPTRAIMDRAMYPSGRRPSLGSRRPSIHISGRDLTSDFNTTSSSNNSHGRRSLTVRNPYADRNKTSAASLDDYGCDLRGGIVYCPAPHQQQQQRPRTLRQTSIPASCAIDPASFVSGFDELPRGLGRATEVYEVPTTLSYAAAAAAVGSDFDGSLRSARSSQTSRPSSRESSSFVYAEYEDEEDKERKRLMGTELYGYVMAMRLKERLVDVRQVLGLYRDFDRVSECECPLSPDFSFATQSFACGVRKAALAMQS